MKKGLLLFAHGARDPRWAEPFAAAVAAVRNERPEVAVALAFLEFMPPTLREAGDALVAAGCTAVDVVPLFLGAGGHVRKDVPVRMAELQAAHPQVRWRLRAAAGESPRLIDALARVAIDALDAPEAREAPGAPDAPDAPVAADE